MHMHVRRTCEQQGLAPQHYTQVNPTPELHVLPVASRVAFVPSHPALVGLIVPCVLGARMHLCVLPLQRPKAVLQQCMHHGMRDVEQRTHHDLLDCVCRE